MLNRYVEVRDMLPPSYIDFVESNDGWQGVLSGEFDYVDLWNRNAIQEFYESYEIHKHLDSRWFVFGSNGGGEMLCFDLDAGTDSVYMLPFIGSANETPILLCESFRGLARRIPK